ncbi:hypothetical protein [Pseudalkalibacillus salsuginis]|uniref:hypothetical protein n=1 Tax=Pseudalkalibacillus salsuginis TaxID=2910972 RepID=UPI001F2E53F3|nr:hypothetical protein [Pseudalkalibacillus salsuginis]MCF6410153.1 hypothetical protein [Pseudalkalibacillus salsuginis]
MDEIIVYIKKHFPFESTEKVAKYLNLSEFKVRTIAKKNHINKNEDYLNELKNQLVKNRRKWYEENIPSLSPTFIQEQLLYGSLLGDGYISLGAKRSINFAYQEHFGESQRDYREWKLSQLENLGFTINGNYLRSGSHPYFTSLRNVLYNGSSKVLTDNFLSKCMHPMFLTALYLDDGSLSMTTRLNKNKKTVYCTPGITISTLNFKRNENHKLANHINILFKTNFVVSSHPHGHGSLLKINKVKEVRQFLQIIAPYSKCIPSMQYKTNIEKKIESISNRIYKKYGRNITIQTSSSDNQQNYSYEEIKRIITLKQSGVKDKEIAKSLNRSYWSIVYKVSELRKDGRLD